VGVAIGHSSVDTTGVSAPVTFGSVGCDAPHATITMMVKAIVVGMNSART
jgi:hypothetical protein